VSTNSTTPAKHSFDRVANINNSL